LNHAAARMAMSGVYWNPIWSIVHVAASVRPADIVKIYNAIRGEQAVYKGKFLENGEVVVVTVDNYYIRCCPLAH